MLRATIFCTAVLALAGCADGIARCAGWPMS